MILCPDPAVSHVFRPNPRDTSSSCNNEWPVRLEAETKNKQTVQISKWKHVKKWSMLNLDCLVSELRPFQSPSVVWRTRTRWDKFSPFYQKLSATNLFQLYCAPNMNWAGIQDNWNIWSTLGFFGHKLNSYISQTFVDRILIHAHIQILRPNDYFHWNWFTSW